MISIVNGLRISATNLAALKSGEVVGAFSKTYLAPDKSFALYPDLQTESSDLVTVDLWAECKSCENIDITFGMSELSQLTALSIEELESIFQQRASIFLLVLRVYKLPNPIQVQNQSTGNFVPLPETVTIFEKIPILDDEQFQEVQDRSKPLDLTIDPEPPSDSFGEDDNFIIINPNPLTPTPPIPPLTNSPDINDLSWIQTISTLGDRSIETDTGKNNWQAGTDFENIVKKGLEFLGFTVDYAHKGGAGGLDLLCLEPYALFGECKAGKKVPNDTAVQLLNLGTLRRKDLFPEAVKLIIGAGKLTPQLEEAAKVHGMAIINAVTLQKLVELKSKYLGSVNLIELRKYFVSGQSNQEIDKYIDKVTNEIKLRSHIINLAKKANREFGIEYLSGVYDSSDHPKPLEEKELYEILIELSSPLAGYLGRDKSDGGKGDRFYYLRDLPI
jgi:hypothetical protein